MTLQEVAEYLHMSKTTIYRYAQQRKIPSTKISRQWRFKREQIDKWMDNQKSFSEQKT